MDRLDAPLDAQLHLLDRQVVDRDGLLVCKVDDVELTEGDGQALWVTALLTGPPALLPRLSRGPGVWLSRLWQDLVPERADHDRPGRIDMSDVARLGSAVHLDVSRERLVGRQPDTDPESPRHRLGDLLEMTVDDQAGQPLGHVLDVRVSPERGTRRLACTHLVVGRGRPGTMLGYDRDPAQGPALVSRPIRWIHRHTGALPLDRVTGVDWEGHRIRAHGPLDRLTPAQ